MVVSVASHADDTPMTLRCQHIVNIWSTESILLLFGRLGSTAYSSFARAFS